MRVPETNWQELVETSEQAPSNDVSVDTSSGIALTEVFVLLDYYFVDTESDVFLFGELQNVSDQAAMSPTVQFTYLDEVGNVYGIEEVPPLAFWVPAGERMPFQTSVAALGGALRPGDWDEVQVTAGTSHYEVDQVTIDGLETRDALS